MNATWGNTVAILTGDFLFARASEISADLGTDVSRLLARTIATLCDGQIREVELAGRAMADEGAYMEIIRRKTAALIATSCRLGGMLSDAPPETIERLDDFGMALGMAFQLSDDIMDVISTEAELRKEPGQDMREGVYTLPVLYALQDEETGRAGSAAGRRRAARASACRRALDIVRARRVAGPGPGGRDPAGPPGARRWPKGCGRVWPATRWSSWRSTWPFAAARTSRTFRSLRVRRVCSSTRAVRVSIRVPSPSILTVSRLRRASRAVASIGIELRWSTESNRVTIDPAVGPPLGRHRIQAIGCIESLRRLRIQRVESRSRLAAPSESMRLVICPERWSSRPPDVDERSDQGPGKQGDGGPGDCGHDGTLAPVRFACLVTALTGYGRFSERVQPRHPSRRDSAATGCSSAEAGPLHPC